MGKKTWNLEARRNIVSFYRWTNQVFKVVSPRLWGRGSLMLFPLCRAASQWSMIIWLHTGTLLLANLFLRENEQTKHLITSSLPWLLLHSILILLLSGQFLLDVSLTSPFLWLSPQLASLSKNVEQQELSVIVRGNPKWYRHIEYIYKTKSEP